jgi:hypothetical protein
MSGSSEAQTSPDSLIGAKAEPDKRWGSRYEILCVWALSLCGAFVWYGIRSGNPLAVLPIIILFGLGIWLWVAAGRRATRVDNELERLTKKSLYVISQYRIHTLEQVNAPSDVTLYLKSLQYPGGLITQDDLLGKLRGALGAERTNEVKNLVLKYTRVDEEQHFDSSRGRVRKIRSAGRRAFGLRRQRRRFGFQHR